MRVEPERNVSLIIPHSPKYEYTNQLKTGVEGLPAVSRYSWPADRGGRETTVCARVMVAKQHDHGHSKVKVINFLMKSIARVALHHQLVHSAAEWLDARRLPGVGAAAFTALLRHVVNSFLIFS